MRRNGRFRVWAMVWAVLQLALPSAATYADARLERESEGPGRSHIESSTTATCRPVHPTECALCQFVARAAAPSGATSCYVVPRVVELPPTAATIDSAASALSYLHPARAPPTA